MWYIVAKFTNTPIFWQQMLQEIMNGKKPDDLCKQYEIPYDLFNNRIKTLNNIQNQPNIQKPKNVQRGNVSWPQILKMHKEHLDGSSILSLARKYNIDKNVLTSLFRQANLEIITGNFSKNFSKLKQKGEELVRDKDPLAKKIIEMYQQGLAPHDISAELEIEQYVIMGVFHASGTAITKGFLHKHDPGNIAKMIEMFKGGTSFGKIAKTMGTTNQQAQKLILRNLPKQDADKLRSFFLQKESAQNKEKLKTAYRLYESGLSLIQVSKKMGFSTSRVRRAIDLFGESARTGPEWQQTEPITDPTVVQAVTDLLDKGYNSEQIKERTGIDENSINTIRYQVFERQRIQNRKTAESMYWRLI